MTSSTTPQATSSGFALTWEQRRAVERTGQDVCVVAGPGSGKTRVLTERFAWLVEQAEVDATRILAITFTEKAAIEIKQRLINRFAAQLVLREQIERAWVSTIHGFCARLLRENAIRAGLSPEFTILEQAPAEQLQREAAEEALDDLLRERPAELRRLLESLDLSTQDNGRQPDLSASLLAIYETMRVSGVDEVPGNTTPGTILPQIMALLHEVLRDPNPGSTANQRLATVALRERARTLLDLPSETVTQAHFEALEALSKINVGHLVKDSPARIAAKTLKNDALPQLESHWLSLWYGDLHDLLREALRRIDATYRERKRRLAAVDFSDLEEFTIRLLESDAALLRDTVARFDQVLMDELQDTNRAQWRLIKLVCGTSPAGSNGKLFAVGDINQSIYGFRHADPEVFAEYRASLREQGAEIDELADNYRSRPEILEAVAHMLDGQTGIEPRTLQPRGSFDFSDGPAVERLVGQENNEERDGARAQDVEAQLVAARIREWVGQGRYRFCDVAVLCRTFGAMQTFEAAFDLFDIPFLVSGGRGFLEARETRDVLALLAALVNPLDEVPLYGVLRGPLVNLRDEDLLRMGREGWQQEFARRFGEIRKLVGFVAPDRLIAMALDACGYVAGLPERARANVDKLLGWLRREHYNRPRPLAEILEDLEALRESESVAEAPPPEAGNIVRMMTIHAAKGLEFPVVFLGALHRGSDRRTPIILFSREHGLGAKWRHPASGKGASDHVHALLSETQKRREDGEDNRLFYVALTRAMDRLVLSYAERKQASAWQKLASSHVPAATLANTLPAPLLPVGQTADRQTEAQEIFAAEVTGQQDASASVTSVAMFAACPRRYYLDRYLRLGQSAAQKNPVAENTAEQGFEEQEFAEVDGLGLPLLGAAELGLEVHRLLSGQEALGGPYSAEARSLANAFHISTLGQRAAEATEAEREFDFMFDVDGMILQGQIDLWFQNQGRLTVVDYKTDRDESHAHAYGLQLRLYALALERYLGRLPEGASLFYVRSGNQVDVSLAPEELAVARASVGAFRKAQETQDFPLRPGEQCWKCPFRAGLCPVGRLAPDAPLV